MNGRTDIHTRIGDRALARWVGAILYAAGGINILSTLDLAASDPAFHGASIAMGTTLLVLAAVMALIPSLPFGLLRLAPFPGVLVISMTVALIGRSDFPLALNGTVLYYLWPVFYAGYFFSRRIFIATIVTMAATLAAALSLVTHDIGPRDTLFIDVVLSVPLAGLIVVVLRERLGAMIARLYSDAMTDPLTGLMNRRAFDDALHHHVAIGRRRPERLALACFDLDHFKRVNDELGHAAGDELLRRFAAVVAAEARNADVVARIGGEEFAVLLTDSDEDGALAFSERVRNTFATITARHGRRQTTSVGIACLDPGEPVSGALLLQRADNALYEAKGAGRDRSAVWSAPHPAAVLTASRPGAPLLPPR